MGDLQVFPKVKMVKMSAIQWQIFQGLWKEKYAATDRNGNGNDFCFCIPAHSTKKKFFIILGVLSIIFSMF
jgi:hypothetical protein